MRHTVSVQMNADYATRVLLCQDFLAHEYDEFDEYKADMMMIINQNKELKAHLAFIYRKETGRMLGSDSIKNLEVVFIKKKHRQETEILFRFDFDWTGKEKIETNEHIEISGGQS